MGKATTVCLYQGETISVEQALDIKASRKRDRGQNPVFTCIECNEPVRPIQKRYNNVVAAHIQHLDVSQNCSLSPKPKVREIDGVANGANRQVAEHAVTAEQLPEEVSDRGVYSEGLIKVIQVNAYERNQQARVACLRHHGHVCKVCRFDFERVYGQFARGYIHVHHLIPLHDIKSEYEVDPINDLVPVCPNCHAAIHLGGKIRSIEELRARLSSCNTAQPSTPADRPASTSLRQNGG